MAEMHDIAKRLVASGKGILAADESTSTANARLQTLGIPADEEHRRQYRELFIGTPGIGKRLSGIILFDETMDQKSTDGKPFLRLLNDEGVLVGIKVDEGKDPDADSFGETVTKGLSSLPERLPAYYEQGARFAKWRAVIRIGESLPSDENMEHESAHMAQYAKMCQEHGIVPIVEPEVLLDGKHSLERARSVTQKTLKTLFSMLQDAEVDLGACILKTSMVLPGKQHPGGKDDPADVARATVDVLQASVPTELAGIVFLSGGQLPIEATENLNAICQREAPWPMTFSYARALQFPAMTIWKGRSENLTSAREAFLKRLKLNALASEGGYAPEME